MNAKSLNDSSESVIRLSAIKNLYFFILAGLIVLTCIYSLEGIYKRKLMAEEMMGSLDRIRSTISSQVTQNPDFFKDPLKYGEKDEVSLGGVGAYSISRGTDAQTMALLSVDSSWIYHHAVSSALGAGKIYLIILGVLVAAIGVAVGSSRKKGVLQLLIAGSLSFVLVISLCFFAYWAYYASKVHGTPLQSLVSELLNGGSIWKQNWLYNIQISIAGWFFWIGYVTTGYFFGAVVPDLIGLLVTMPVLNIGLDLLIRYPITPVYFLHRIIGRFLAVYEGGMIYLAPYSPVNLLLFLGSMVGFLLFSGWWIQRRDNKVVF